MNGSDTLVFPFFFTGILMAKRVPIGLDCRRLMGKYQFSENTTMSLESYKWYITK